MLFRLRFARLAPLVLLVVMIAGITGVDSSPHPIDPGDTKQVFEREDAYINGEVAMHHFRGAVLVGIDGDIVFEKAYGPADEEWDVPNTAKTKFRIASLTKQFTAACILLLQERGLLHVQDRVSNYLTDQPTAWKEVTIHQLLTHTGGIPNPDYASKQSATIQRMGATPREAVAQVASWLT